MTGEPNPDVPAAPTPLPEAPSLPSGSATPGPTPPVQPGPKKPRWVRAIVMCVGGLALAIGGCGLFVETIDTSTPLGTIGGIGFSIGIISMLVGGLMAAAYILSALVRAFKS